MDKSSVIKFAVYGVVVLGGVAAIVAILNPGKIDPRRDFTDEERALVPPTEAYATPSIAPGIERPENEDAGKTEIDDSEEVIGVVVDDQARAYRVTAFLGVDQHVVNDLLAGVPVSVTYCDRSDLARVFTDDAAAEPLQLGTGGWSGEHLLLRLDEKNFEQTSEEIPLQEKEFERSTWSEWKAKHPGTTVYAMPPAEDAGDPDPAPPQAADAANAPSSASPAAASAEAN